MLSQELMDGLAEIWNKDYPDAKFKRGDTVVVVGARIGTYTPLKLELIGNRYKVIAVNWADEDVYEYALDGCPIVMWEDELVLVQGENDGQ